MMTAGDTRLCHTFIQGVTLPASEGKREPPSPLIKGDFKKITPQPPASKGREEILMKHYLLEMVL